jgi:DNA-binding response OmpR family regulator
MTAKKRILIVDDEEAYAEILRDRLIFEGYEAEIALDGEKGLDALRSGGFDAALIDLMMPGIDGFELIARLRAEGGAMAKIPLAVVTAYGDLFPQQKRHLLGGVVVLHKPYDISEFLETLRGLLAG